MNTPRTGTLLLAGFAVLFAACSNGSNGNNGDVAQVESAKGGDLAPHEVVLASAAALHDNELQTFLKTSLPASKYAKLKANWAAKKDKPVSEEEKAQYRKTMTRLTQEGAVDKIMADLKPKLAKMSKQMPMFIGMFSGIAQASLAQQKDLSAEDKAQAQQFITAISGWAMSTDLTSPELARQAVETAVATARELDLPTVESVRALTFDEMLAKGSAVLSGAKDILAVYGLKVNQMLESIEAQTVKQQDGEAVVQVSFDFLGTQQSMKAPMVKQDGQWVAKKALETDVEVAAQAENAKASETN